MNIDKLDDIKWWKREIKRRSRSLTKVLLCIAIPIFLIVITFYAYLTVYIPEGGWVGPLYFSPAIVKFAKFVAILVGSTGITAVWGLLSRLQPDSMNYHDAARAIVEELENSNVINSGKADKMRDEIAIKLSPCDDPRNAKLCKKVLLEEVAKALAEIAVSRVEIFR